jgi:glycosyltransferase involved in cell wall biosynthesis
MKRAVVTLGHPDHAGMLRALKVLSEAGPRHGWDLRFVLAGRHPLVEAVGLPADRIIYLRALRRWRGWPARLVVPAAVLRLARVARDADLLYACTLSSFPYCLLAGRLVRRPQVAHVYSSYGEPSAYRKHLLGKARNVIAPSADSLALARAGVGGFAPDAQTWVVYNGLDVGEIARQAAAPLPAALRDGAGLSIGMVGNLDPRKNPALLIEATAALRAAVPDLRVLLVGAFRDAGYEAIVRARIQAHGLETAVQTTGFLANPFPVVRGLDVLVHPARRDPFPLALLEGMALARPIVASAVGGIPEMLVDGESGVLVPPDDVDALASAVLGLLRDRDRRARIGAAAYARLTTAFSLDGFAAGMFAAFDAAVAAGR